MIDVLKKIIGGLVGVMSWTLVLMVLGLVARVNYEIFMFGWGFFK